MKGLIRVAGFLAGVTALEVSAVLPSLYAGQATFAAWLLVAPPETFGAKTDASTGLKWIVLEGFQSQQDCEQARQKPMLVSDGDGNRQIKPQPPGEECLPASEVNS
jgi:hypothetical protein